MHDLVETIDMEILMHRDIHFGGSFDVMIEYYEQDGIGVMPDFQVDQMKRLQELEKELKQNLSELYLPEAAKDIVKEAQKLYADLREIYEQKEGDALLSDLILSEEEIPKNEMEALIEKKGEAVPALIHLLSSHTFYDPLFPGYGRSPIFAAQCLSKIQDERAIPPLFEALGQENFFTDEEIILALASFGEKSKTFLIKRLKGKPFSKDNEYAAIALSGFGDDEEIAQAALDVLERKETLKKPLFSSYLVFACSALTQQSDRERLSHISQMEELLPSIRDEISIVVNSWNKG